MQFLALFALLSLGEVPLTLPQEVKGKPGEFLVIKADTPSPTVRFVLLDPGLSLFPPDLLKDAKVCVVYAPKPGRYRVLAFCAKGDEPSQPVTVQVIIEGDTPTPPTPPAPGPVDPLAQRFQATYTADKGDPAANRTQLSNLTGLYQAVAEISRDPTHFKTMGDVLTELQATARAMVRPDVLVELRKLIAAEVNATLGTNAALTLDAVKRAQVTDCFTRIAKALEQVK